MNIMTTIAEIGIMETCRVAAKYPKEAAILRSHLPAAETSYIEKRISQITQTIICLEKDKLFLLTPEIALLESLANMGWMGTALLAIPYNMDHESKERLANNIPPAISTQLVAESAYPASFRPDNGVIVCAGMAPEGYRPYILPSSCRMMGMYRMFHGHRYLLACFPKEERVPEYGWSYAESDFFTGVI